MEKNDQIKFGKYKGKTFEYIYQNDKDYFTWLYENIDNTAIKELTGTMLGYYTTNKIEEIVKHCLINSGYAESEAALFIRKLKSNK